MSAHSCTSLSGCTDATVYFISPLHGYIFLICLPIQYNLEYSWFASVLVFPFFQDEFGDATDMETRTHIVKVFFPMYFCF